MGFIHSEISDFQNKRLKNIVKDNTATMRISKLLRSNSTELEKAVMTSKYVPLEQQMWSKKV